MIFRLYVSISPYDGAVSPPMVLDLPNPEFVLPLFDLVQARALAAALYEGSDAAYPIFEIGNFDTDTGVLASAAGVRDLFDGHEALADASWQSAPAPVLPRVGRIKRSKMH